MTADQAGLVTKLQNKTPKIKKDFLNIKTPFSEDFWHSVFFLN